MTQLLSTLKLTPAKKQRVMSAPVKRRHKLLQKLAEQRELAVATVEGRKYAPTRLRTVMDPQLGRRIQREIPVRIKAWWWTGSKGETLLSIFYGTRLLELSQGNTAIEVGTIKNLPAVLDVVINATRNCELDAQLEAASTKLRDGFKH